MTLPDDDSAAEVGGPAGGSAAEVGGPAGGSAAEVGGPARADGTGGAHEPVGRPTVEPGEDPDDGYRRPPIYTRTGDDGTTGLLYGGRVRKDAPAPAAYGDVDEAQAHIGVVRSVLSSDDSELDAVLVSVARDLWVLMAELATAAENRDRLEDDVTRVSTEMVEALEHRIDACASRFRPPSEFVVPGGDRVSAQLDLARAVVRRAERRVLSAAHPDSLALVYLNRLSDLLWTLARFVEGEALTVRSLRGDTT